MQHTFKLVAVAAALCAASAAQAAVGFDANLELDTTYLNDANGRKSDLNMAGRVELNAAAKATNGDAFVAGRASLLIKKDGDAAVDDLWVQFGNAGADVKLGRFEAVDLFPLAKDTVVDEVAGTYKANALRGRFGSNTFHGALGLNAGAGMRVELGLVQSKTDGNVKGVRPAVVYTTGPLTLRAGFESVKTVGSTAGSETGVGLSLGYALSADTNVNVNYAKKEDDKTFGANITMGAAGLGLISGKGATEASKSTTVYMAYSLPLMGVKGATITPALSFSKGGSGTDGQTAARVRINYAF